VRIGGRDVPTPLVTLRTLLGDERASELEECASEVCFREEFSADELTYLAEFFRQCATVQAWKEANGARRP
jgi:hypothetical protein